MAVYTCRIELKNEEDVVYHDISNVPRPGKIRATDLDKRLLRSFNSWVSKDKLKEREDLELLGLCLYELLFPPASNIRDEFEGNYDFVTKQEGSRLRLTLVFHEDAGELANYPWEFLYLPPRPRTPEKPNREGFFLAGQKTELILARFLPDVEHRLGEKEKELRILIVFSNPDDENLDDLDTRETKDAIEMIKALERPASQVKVKLINNPTFEELKDAINEPEKLGAGALRPHIVHFIGHGDKKLGLALQMTKDDCTKRRDNGETTKIAFWCNSKTICELFSKDPPPRLVFLHACEGAKADTPDGFSDLARELASAKIPAVIAMQYAIRPALAAAFAKVFYEELGTGSDVDRAVSKGREALGLPIYGGKGSWSNRAFGTPVVYLQSERAIIEIPALPPPPPDIDLGYDQNEKVACPNPKCDSRVLPDWSVCLACDHGVMICPQCLEQKTVCRMIDKTKGICASCLYRIGGQPTGAVTPGALSTSGSVEPQQPVPPSPAASAPSLSGQTPGATYRGPENR